MRHHLGAVARTDAFLEQFDNLVDGARIDQTLLDQEGFQRLDAQRRLRRRFSVGVLIHRGRSFSLSGFKKGSSVERLKYGKAQAS
jgi:hypothetical protein